MGNIVLSGATSGATTLVPTDAVTATITLPSATGTLTNTSQVIGIGQTATDVGASRTMGTTYTNSTGKPIVVYVSMSNSVSSPIVINYINGVLFYGSASPSAGTYYSVTMIVPTGMTYSISMNGVPTLVSWVEIR